MAQNLFAHALPESDVINTFYSRFTQHADHPKCRDEEGCPEKHPNDHNFALETIQLPSFWGVVRLDVLHDDKAPSRDTAGRHGRGSGLHGGMRPGRACREPKLAAGSFAFIRRLLRGFLYVPMQETRLKCVYDIAFQEGMRK